MGESSSSTDWIAAVARRAKANIQEVENVLTARRIVPSPITGTPRRLLLKEVVFEGVKDGVPTAGPFRFEWSDLDRGLWAITSDRNFRGKSTVFEVVKWLLRGSIPNKLQDDVLRWIQTASLQFNLDEIPYRVSVENSKEVSGRLVRVEAATERVVGEFSNSNEFEAVMGSFFMTAFSLETVATWQTGTAGNEGRPVSHGWPALSGVLFIGTDYTSLLGELPPASGLPVRLLQMYLGLPWVSTLTSAKTVSEGLRREAERRERELQAFRRLRSERIRDITATLEERNAELLRIGTYDTYRKALDDLMVQYGDLQASEHRLQARVYLEESAVKTASDAHSEDRRDLQSYIDSEACNAVFKKLDPSCCPRCETEIDALRRVQERETHACSVCGTHLQPDPDSVALRKQLEGSVIASRAALQKAREQRSATQLKLENIRSELSAVDSEICVQRAMLPSMSQAHRLEVDVASLAARLEEARLDFPATVNRSSDEHIVEAILSETTDRVRDSQGDLLYEVSQRIAKYARQFGMEALTSATLKGNLNLSLVKGGQETSYSKCTDGEKLRLKVAAVLAMICVAEVRGVGRHPGILMIDSPSAQEVSPVDLAALVSGLNDAAHDFEHLQVFVAARASAAIVGSIADERLIYASGDEYLW